MYYFNARWYDAETGKFVTQDPARDGINWYAYCLNNPLKYFDPLGLESEEGTTNSNLWDNVESTKGYTDFWGPFKGRTIKWAGNKIHRAVQEELKNTYGGEIEKYIPGAGRADYIYDVFNEIYEVKPNTQYNDQSGKDQLQNYVDYERGSQKGTFLLPIIPKDIKIKNLEIIKTKNLRVTCDVACRTNIEDPNHAGMIYYVPYNWRIDKSSSISTFTMISMAVFGSIAKSTATSCMEIIENQAAATLIIIPSVLLNTYSNKNPPIDDNI